LDDIPKNIKIKWFNKKDLSEFKVIVRPTNESLWYKGKYYFRIKIVDDYPFEPPKVICETKVK